MRVLHIKCVFAPRTVPGHQGSYLAGELARGVVGWVHGGHRSRRCIVKTMLFDRFGTHLRIPRIPRIPWILRIGWHWPRFGASPPRARGQDDVSSKQTPSNDTIAKVMLAGCSGKPILAKVYVGRARPESSSHMLVPTTKGNYKMGQQVGLGLHLCGHGLESKWTFPWL